MLLIKALKGIAIKETKKSIKVHSETREPIMDPLVFHGIKSWKKINKVVIIDIQCNSIRIYKVITYVEN